MNMERKSGIYMWTSPSGKSYIGQSVDLVDRHREFVRFNKSYSGIIIDRARKKYNNINDWKYKVLEYCGVDKLDEREKYYIALYDTMNNGYNSNAGGEGNVGLKQNEETRRKISLSQIGEKNHNYGKPRPLEVRRKISESERGKIVSDEQRLKLSKAHDNVKIAVSQYTKEGVYIASYDSSLEAQRKTGVHNSHIVLCCRGERKSAGGFKWTFKNPPLLKKNEGLNKN